MYFIKHDKVLTGSHDSVWVNSLSSVYSLVDKWWALRSEVVREGFWKEIYELVFTQTQNYEILIYF